MSRKVLLEPDVVREIARDYHYEEIPVSYDERDRKLSFSHPAKAGCGGPDYEVIIINYY